jgi:type IV pilus assembly protein PilW
MIALLIGLFLLGGLSILVQDNKRTFTTQNSLSQLQDSQRLAMSMITDIVQQTGYFVNPRRFTLGTALIAQGTIPAGQPISGVYGGGPTSAPGDTIIVRYQTNSGDGILNCTGQSNTTGAPQAYMNSFYVAVNGGVSQLMCAMTAGGAAAVTVPLVNNVKSLGILYGVNTSGFGSNVNRYMTATQVTAAGDWTNVISVQVTLVFVNPLYSATNVGQGTQPQTISFSRVVSLMADTGV